jgi:transcriptional regulator with XRE-family HTH domain
MSQERLADYASLHRTEISKLENCERLPRLDTVVKLAGALRVDPGDLLAGMRWEAGSTHPGHFVESWELERELACGDG